MGQVEATVERLKGSDNYHIIPFTNQSVVTTQDSTLKTLRHGVKDGLELPGDLLPMSHGDRDHLYTHQLLSETPLRREEHDTILTPQLDNWEQDHMALVDIILIEMAIAEALSYPDITLIVMIDEYIGLAKVHDDAKSTSFVNTTLDRFFTDLKGKNKLLK